MNRNRELYKTAAMIEADLKEHHVRLQFAFMVDLLMIIVLVLTLYTVL